MGMLVAESVTSLIILSQNNYENIIMKILFVAIAFPPKNDPECLQGAKYYKYLKSWQKDISILTSAIPTLFLPYDKSLDHIVDKEAKIVEIKIPENKYLNFLLRKISLSCIQLPDTKFSFFLQWRKAVRKIKEKPELIYSRSNPISSALMALKLVKYYKVPWVLHLSDPWVDNPLNKRSKFATKINSKWELACFELATFITLTSQKTVDLYSKKYPEYSAKFILMPNVYDPEAFSTTAEEINFNDSLRFIYTGSLTENRSPELLFKTIEKIQAEDPMSLENVEFVFAGHFDRKCKELFKKYDLPCVKNLGLLSYTKAKELQNAANVLIAIDSPAKTESEALFFPSKLLDYIVTRKKIVAITDLNSTTYNVVHNKYGYCVAHHEVDELARILHEIIDAYKNKVYSFFISKLQSDNTYSAENNAERLNDLFVKALALSDKR